MFIYISLFLLIIIYLIYYFSKSDKRNKDRIDSIINRWKHPRFDAYYNFDKITSYFNHVKSGFSKNDYYVDDDTVNDLDLNELFIFLDRTSSKIGQQFLYASIRHKNDTDNKTIDNLSKDFINNPDERKKIQLILDRLNSDKTYEIEKLIFENINKPKYVNLYYYLLISILLVINLSFLNIKFILLLIPLFFINSVIHYKNKKVIYYYVQAIQQLLLANNLSKKLSKQKIINRAFPNLDFIKKINNIKFRSSYIIIGESLNNPASILLWLLYEIVNILFNLEGIIFYSLIDKISALKNEINMLYRFIGSIDTAISLSAIRSTEATCTPEFTDSKILSFKNIYHPLIPNCVKNSLSLDNQSLLLTGSNMSGKTSFIRTIAINNLLANHFNFCFADQYVTNHLKIKTSIRISDDLFDNKSYYLQEVLRIKEFVDNIAHDNSLIALDELFKGTNTVERIAISNSVLKYLNNQNNIVLVSTHDIELVDMLSKHHYALFHFSENVSNNELNFDYKLKKGPLQTKNAIKILELYDYPDSIIKEAISISNRTKI